MTSNSAAMATLLCCMAVLALMLTPIPASCTMSPLHRLRHGEGPAARDDPVHTWHNVSALSGSWKAVLSVLNEQVSFVDRIGATVTSFPVSPQSSFEYGTVLVDGDTFDVLYQLTMIEDASSSVTAESRRVCLFVISAKSAANPQIAPFSFTGDANCTWKANPGIGEVHTPPHTHRRICCRQSAPSRRSNLTLLLS
jgi:hypothetical protein